MVIKKNKKMRVPNERRAYKRLWCAGFCERLMESIIPLKEELAEDHWVGGRPALTMENPNLRHKIKEARVPREQAGAKNVPDSLNLTIHEGGPASFLSFERGFTLSVELAEVTLFQKPWTGCGMTLLQAERRSGLASSGESLWSGVHMLWLQPFTSAL